MTQSSVSVFKAQAFSHTWTINNFLDFHKFYKLDYDSFGDELYSVYANCVAIPFQLENYDDISVRLETVKNEQFELFLEIIPFKHTDGDVDSQVAYLSVGVYCKLIDTELEKNHFKFEISLLGEDDRKLVTKSDNAGNIKGFKYKQLELVYYHDFYKNPGMYLSNSNLRIMCEVKYNFQLVVDNYLDNYVDLVQEQAQQFKKNLSKLSDIWNSRKFTDLTFEVKFGENPLKEIKAHKMFLVSGTESQYFWTMFKNADWSEAQQNKITITDFEASVVEATLEFIYTGNVKLVVGLEDKLLAIANKWEMESLKSLCERSLCAKISAETVHDLIALADIHNATLLKSKALAYFKSNPQLLNIDDNEELLVELIRRSAQKRAAGDVQNEDGTINKKPKN